MAAVSRGATVPTGEGATQTHTIHSADMTGTATTATEGGKMSKQTTDSYGMTAAESAATVARIEFEASGNLEAALFAGHRAACPGGVHPLDAQVRAELDRRAAMPAEGIFAL